MNKRYFQCSEGLSNKFWEIWIEGSAVFTRYGKIGTAGQTTIKDQCTADKAQKLYDKLIREKTEKKGYVEKAGSRVKTDKTVSLKKKYLNASLRLEGPTAARVRKVVSTGVNVRSNILAILAKAIGDTPTLPEWLVIESSQAMDQVIHLSEPLFSIQGYDGDEFWSEVARMQLIYTGKGKATRIKPDEEDSAQEGIAIPDNRLSTLTGWQTHSDAVLADLKWVEPSPQTRRAFEKLMKGAEDALFDDVHYWETPAPVKPSKTPPSTHSGPPPIIWGGPSRDHAAQSDGPRSKPKVVWRQNRVEISGDEWGGFPVVANGAVYGGHRAFLSAVNAKTGKKLWEVSTSTSRAWPMGQAAVADGVVYACNQKALFALEQKTGKERWQWRASQIQGSPLIHNGIAYVASKDAINAVDLANGRKLWAYPVKGEARAPIAQSHGVLFVTVNDRLLAIDAATGKKTLWNAKGSFYGSFGPTLIADLVIARGIGKVIAFHQTTGKPVWEYAIDYDLYGSLNSGPIAAADGKVIVRSKKALHAINASTGKCDWICTKTPSGYSDLSMVVAGGVIYAIIEEVPDRGNVSITELVAVSLERGKLLWKLSERDIVPKDPSGFRSSGGLAVNQGTLFIAMWDGLIALAE